MNLTKIIQPNCDLHKYGKSWTQYSYTYPTEFSEETYILHIVFFFIFSPVQKHLFERREYFSLYNFILIYKIILRKKNQYTYFKQPKCLLHPLILFLPWNILYTVLSTDNIISYLLYFVPISSYLGLPSAVSLHKSSVVPAVNLSYYCDSFSVWHNKSICVKKQLQCL